MSETNEAPQPTDFRATDEILIRRDHAATVDAYGREPFTAFWLKDGSVQRQDCVHQLNAYITRVTRNNGRAHRLI